MPSYQKLQCRLSAPYIVVACDGGLQRKKINTDDHLSMCSCSGGTELDKAAKFRISRSAWCTFSRGEQIRGYVHRENEHRGAHFRGWCTNSLANLCAGARLRGGGGGGGDGGGDEYAVTPASCYMLADLAGFTSRHQSGHVRSVVAHSLPARFEILILFVHESRVCMTVLFQCKLWLLPGLFISQSPAHH